MQKLNYNNTPIESQDLVIRRRSVRMRAEEEW
jgi:hypothetical protein